MKKKKVILCDQDGVLIDKTYSCNYSFDGLNGLLLENNAIIVPHSDTPVQRLRNNFELFAGIKIGTLIAERGAIIVHDNKEIFTVDLPKDALADYKKEIYNVALDFKVPIYSGDSATWIRNSKVFEPNKNIIIFDAFRETSLGYYARKTNSLGLATVDAGFYDEFTSEAKKIARPKFLDIEDYNQSYGIVILSSSKATKTLGFEKFFPLMGDEACEYYMIGDSKTDIIEHAGITHLAVGNCDESLRERANFISPSNCAKGMMECIDYALSN